MDENIDYRADELANAVLIQNKENEQLRKDLAGMVQVNAEQFWLRTQDHEKILSIQVALAEREAENLKLREVLGMFPNTLHPCPESECLCSQCEAVRSKREALSTPPSTSYLEMWEREKYGEPIVFCAGVQVEFQEDTKFYARKD
jgi:hypothetical protein